MAAYHVELRGQHHCNQSKRVHQNERNEPSRSSRLYNDASNEAFVFKRLLVLLVPLTALVNYLAADHAIVPGLNYLTLVICSCLFLLHPTVLQGTFQAVLKSHPCRPDMSVFCAYLEISKCSYLVPILAFCE